MWTAISKKIIIILIILNLIINEEIRLYCKSIKLEIKLKVNHRSIKLQNINIYE